MTQGELAAVLEQIRNGDDPEGGLLVIVEQDLAVLERIVQLLPDDAISLLQSEPDKQVWEAPAVQLVEHEPDGAFSYRGGEYGNSDEEDDR